MAQPTQMQSEAAVQILLDMIRGKRPRNSAEAIELGPLLDTIDIPTQAICDAGGGKKAESFWGEVLRWLDKQDAATQKRLFVDWKPFDHPQLGEVLIGGFVSHEQQNQTLTALRPLAAKCTEFTMATR